MNTSDKATGKTLVNSLLLVGFDTLARQYQLNAVGLVKAQGLPVSLLHDQNILLDHQAAARLLNSAARLSHQPLFGLQLAESVNLSALGGLGIFFAQQPSLAHFYPHLERLHSIRASLGRHRLQIKGEQAFHKVGFTSGDNLEFDQLLLLSLGACHRILRQLLGQQWQPLQVYLTSSQALDLRILEDFFGCPVTLRSEMNGFRFAAKHLNARPRIELLSGPELADSLTQFLHGFDSLEELLSHTILSLLQTGDANLATIASCVNLSPRVLQKQLKTAGLSYSTLLRQARDKQACMLLRETRLPITDIALQLDYAEPAVFSRAFKKWHGISPQQWRRQQTISQTP